MWNAASFITGCLNSIAAQTYSDFECICVDDGSPDNCAKLVEDFAKNDQRFRVIYQHNTKQAGARNHGLQQATGELITFIDADDYIHPQMLEILVDTLQRENVEVVGCSLIRTSKVYQDTAHQPILATKQIIFDNPIQALMKKRNVQTEVCGKLYKRSVLANIAFPEGIYFEDVPWTVNVMLNIQKYVLVPVALYYYYSNPNSTMSSQWSNEKTDSYIKVIQIVYDTMLKQNPKLLDAAKKYICNQRLKMIFNRIKKMPKNAQVELWMHAAPLIQGLYQNGQVSYAGLKLKHKVTLWRVLHAK